MKNSDVKKTPFLVKANTNSGEISQVIGPHRTLFKEGLSGSLTQLFNGASYIEAGSNVTVTSGSNGSIMIASTGGSSGGADEGASFVLMGTTASLANERELRAGTGVNVTDAGAGSTVTLSVNDSVVATVSGTRFTGVVDASAGISGSLTRLSDGTSYLIAGSNVTITSASAGVMISSTGGSAPAVAYVTQSTDYSSAGTAWWLQYGAMSASVTVADQSRVAVDFNSTMKGSGAINFDFRLTINSASVCTRGQYQWALPEGVSITYLSTPLSAGSYAIVVEHYRSGTTLQCLAATTPQTYGASLRVIEIA